MPKHPPGNLPDLQCACASLRRAARLVTQLYSHEMDSRLEPSQFALLAMLSRSSESSQTPLGRDLGLDKTTLSRNLRLLCQNGWIEPVKSGDRRQHGYRLTAEGKKLLSDAKPGWLRAQARLRAALEPGEWETMMNTVARVTEAARSARLDEES